MEAVFRYVIFLTALLVAASAEGVAQPPLTTFEYDAGGNMIERISIVLDDKSDDGKDGDNTDDTDNPDDITSGITDRQDTQSITIYPNPTTGTLSIAITELKGKENNVMRLYDVAGRLIKSQKISGDMTTLQIDGAAGLYLLDIHLGSRRSNWKIIKR